MYKGHSSASFARAIVWSPDGQRIASTSYTTAIAYGNRRATVKDDRVHVWSATKGKLLFTYQGHTDDVSTLVWSPDGRRIASGCTDKTVQVWDAEKPSWRGHNALRYDKHSSFVSAISWSPVGKHIASGGFDCELRVWDATTGKTLFIHENFSRIVAVAWSPDDKQVASADQWRVDICNAASGAKRTSLNASSDHHILDMVWSPDGRYIATAENTRNTEEFRGVVIWNVTSGKESLSYEGHLGPVQEVDWSSDGKYIASGSNDGTVKIWNVATGGNIFTYSAHAFQGPVPVEAVAWSPDGSRIASSSWDGMVHVWQAI